MKSGWQIGPDTWRARAQQAKRDHYAQLRQRGLSPVDAIKEMGMAWLGPAPARYERWYRHQLAQREPAESLSGPGAGQARPRGEVRRTRGEVRRTRGEVRRTRGEVPGTRCGVRGTRRPPVLARQLPSAW